MTTEFKNCQSCGMPLKRDTKGGGTNADGSISKMYCSYCYDKGEFIYQGNNVNEFQEYCKQKNDGRRTLKILLLVIYKRNETIRQVEKLVTFIS